MTNSYPATRKGCPRCGLTGLHSCTGAPIVWREGEVEELRATLDSLFCQPDAPYDLEQPPVIYLDLDGVMVDFYGAAERLIGRPYKEVKGAQAWGILDKVPHFFRDLDPLPDAHHLWQGLQAFASGASARVEILSAFPKLTRELVSACADKREWVRAHVCPDIHVNLVAGGAAKAAFAHPRAVLIDDLPRNIDSWVAAGGIGILHRNAQDTLTQLERVSADLSLPRSS